MARIQRLLYRVEFLDRARSSRLGVKTVVEIEESPCDMVSSILAERAARAFVAQRPDAENLVLLGSVLVGPANGWPDVIATD